jgi:hypothetical protein
LEWFVQSERSSPTVAANSKRAKAAGKTTGAIPEVISKNGVRVRGLIFSPERNISERRNNQPFFVGGDTIFEYARKCFCPEVPRITCSTVYDYTRWGHLERIVRYVKDSPSGSPLSIEDLYRFLGQTESSVGCED